MQKTLTSFSHSHDDSSEPVPSTSSESVDNRLSTQEGKQTSQESVSTCKSPRPNQAPVINVDCHGPPRLKDTESGAVIHQLAQNSAVSARGRILTR